MADPIMISGALQPVCGFINNTGLPAVTARQFSSLFCIKRNRRKLTEANEDLQAVEKMVQGEVNREADQLNKCPPLVELWLSRVDEVPISVDYIDQEFDQLMQYNCFCNPILTLGKRCSLGKLVLRTLELVRKLIEEGKGFEVFGCKPEPDLVEERPRIEAFGIKPVLKHLRGLFNSSTVGIIGVWGPGGVGKTTLLNTFNNELKELGSDYQDLPPCDHFEWIEDYIKRIQKEDKNKVSNLLPAVEQLGSATVHNGVQKDELKKMAKQLETLVDLKKQSNMLAAIFYLCAIVLGIVYLQIISQK